MERLYYRLTWLFGFLFPWGIASFFLGHVGSSRDSTAFFSFIGFLLCSPLIILHSIKIFINNAGKSKFDAFVNSNGGSKYNSFSNGTGIAINDEDKMLFLSSGSKMKKYLFKDIRSWNKKLSEGGIIHGSGMNALMANADTVAINAKNTGIFIQVKDIDTPEWHIKISKKNEMDRWFEILQQLVNNE